MKKGRSAARGSDNHNRGLHPLRPETPEEHVVQQHAHKHERAENTKQQKTENRTQPCAKSPAQNAIGKRYSLDHVPPLGRGFYSVRT